MIKFKLLLISINSNNISDQNNLIKKNLLYIRVNNYNYILI
jgi:hypothetical protein